jgi:hypothetical protein
MTESASHDTSHAHEPPPPDEPKSPMWLPALGAALFITVGLWWAVTPSPPPPPPEEPEAAASAAPQAAASAAPRPAVAPGGGAGAPGAGGPDNAALQRILEKLPKQ